MSDKMDEVRRIMAKPMPETKENIGNCDPNSGDELCFDPWQLFPAVYGCYSSEFDDLAIEVLTEQLEHKWERNDLSSEIFKEMLCVSGMADYGTSPRGCFPTSEFEAILPELIAKWKTYRDMQWSWPLTTPTI